MLVPDPDAELVLVEPEPPPLLAPARHIRNIMTTMPITRLIAIRKIVAIIVLIGS